MHSQLSLKKLLLFAPFIALSWVLGLTTTCIGATPEKTVSQIFVEEGKAVIFVYKIGSGNEVQGFGSGILLKQNGIFVTNFHVIERAEAVSIKLSDGREFPVTGIIALNPDIDLAILKVDADKLPVATLGDSDAITVGERIIAIGSPMGLENTVSDGLVSAIREEDGKKNIQISSPISPGSSGGAVFNMKGEVIGVTFAYLIEGQNLNFAIPINYVKKMLKEGKVNAFSPDALVFEEDCPVIGNIRSGIYHLPGGQFYDQMRFSPDGICLQSEEEAQREGLRRSLK